MKKHILIFSLMVVFCGFCNETIVAQSRQQQQTQQGPRLKSKKNRINKWTATANEAFEGGRYFKAFGYYDRALQREVEGPFKMLLRQRLGETQRRLNNPTESVVYFDRVWESGNRERDFMMSYGDVLLKTAGYEKAENVYQVLFRQDTTNLFLRNRLESAKLGRAYNDSMDVVFKDQIRQQKGISTPFSQYGMVIVDGKLVYSSAQRVKPAMTDQRTGHGFSHLYMATMRPDSLLWENPQPLSFNIWGDQINDGVFTFDHVNRIGYFQRCNDGNCGIFTTTLENGEWTIPQKFQMNGVAATSVVGHPAISPDGKRLIFTTRGEGGQGGSDLWMTTKVERQAPATTGRRRGASTANPATSSRANTAATRQTTREQAAPPSPAQQRAAARRGGGAPAAIINNQDWNVPVNLGKIVNTPGDEVFPIWINDYAIAFSSNGHVGYGGLDIYVALADSNWNFNELHHLQPPINSSFDDYTLVISPNISHVFFSSSRYAGFGYSDEIYSFPKTAAVLEFQIEVRDKETDQPLADVWISVCDANDSCRDVVTDDFGKAEIVTRKTTSFYHVFADKDDFYKDTTRVFINQAFDIIPLRDSRQVSIALQRDTTLRIEYDSIPARWEFLAQNLEDDLIEVIAVATLDTLAQLMSLNDNACVEKLTITLNPSNDYTLVGEIRAMDTPLSRDTIVERIRFIEVLEATEISPDSTHVSTYNLEQVTLDTCSIFYHEKEAFFTLPVVSHVEGEFTITGTMNYSVVRPDSTFVFTDVPFSVVATGTLKPVVEIEEPLAAVTDDEPILEEIPPIMWFYDINQTRGNDEVELVAKAIIRPDVFMISNQQPASEKLSPIVFNFNPDDENFEPIGDLASTTDPLTLSPEITSFLTEPISVFIDSVTFVQRIRISSPDDFRVTGTMAYTLGFDQMIDMETDTMNLESPSNFKAYNDVPLSFFVFGLDVQEQIVEEPIVVEEIIEEDLSWTDGLALIETPNFTPYKISIDECDSINLMTECMRPGMTPQQIIDCIDRKRRDCEELVDTRFVENYKDRINDPNRRANLAVLPPGTPCKDCGKQPLRHYIDTPLHIQATDDKQTLRFTDNAGNTTFFDLAPNTRYGIEVRNLMIGDVAALPSHLSSSDIIKTVTTRDYVIFECIPKLAEIGDENYINNIYFDFNESDIIRDGHRELDRMIIIAIKNPHLKFEITSHADERGSVEFNQDLTERRLNSVLDYIRRKGMDAARLITRAASNLEPLVRGAQTEEEHALNRRTTIRLYDPNAINELGYDYELQENSPLYTKGIWFRVQIAAYREAPEYPLYLFSEYLRAAQGHELTFFQDRDGLYKFTFGEFQDLNQARRLNQRILDANLESYVVAFVDGQRVTVAEAQAVLNRQAKR